VKPRKVIARLRALRRVSTASRRRSRVDWLCEYREFHALPLSLPDYCQRTGADERLVTNLTSHLRAAPRRSGADSGDDASRLPQVTGVDLKPTNRFPPPTLTMLPTEADCLWQRGRCREVSCRG